MITKFKIFENVNTLPKVGDYVFINTHDDYQLQASKNYESFLKNNIGQIIDSEIEHGGISIIYKIKFENIPDDIQSRYFGKYNYKKFRIESFKYWSSDKNELEVMMNTEKYNL